MLLKCCTQYVSKFGNLNSGHMTGKGQFSFQSQRRTVTKNVSYHTIVIISQASKVMFKILQPRLQQYVNQDLSDVQAGFQRNQRANSQHSLDYRKNKTSASASLTILKPLIVWITTNYGTFLRDGNTRQTTLPVS